MTMRDPRRWYTDRVAAAACATLAVGGCAPAERTSRLEVAPLTQSVERDHAVVLVVMDGVRWQDIFLGVDPVLADRYGVPVEERLEAERLTPNLHRLMTEDGASIGAPGVGQEMRASGPNFVSLPGYMEMLTGRTDFGCTNNDCGQVRLSTVADDVARQSPGSSAVISSWAGIGRAATGPFSRAMVSVGRYAGEGRSALERDPELSRLLAEGASARPEPGHDDFRPDVHTARIGLALLGSHEARAGSPRGPKFLFLGLGETDEYGHRADYRGYLQALVHADATIGQIAQIVRQENEARRPTTLFVTTDHGRSEGFVSHGEEQPESARVFLVAAGAGIRARGAIASEKRRYLADVGQTARAALGVPIVREGHAGEVLTELLVPQESLSL